MLYFWLGAYTLLSKLLFHFHYPEGPRSNRSGQRSDDRLVVPSGDVRQQVYVLFTRLWNIVQVAEEFFVAARRRHQNMARIRRADIGKAVDRASRNLDPCARPRHLDFVANEVLQLSLDHDEE